MSDKQIDTSRSGTYMAYMPQFLDVDKKWKSIPTAKRLPIPGISGVPAPKFHGDTNEVIGLLGFHQAIAIAHWFLADVENQDVLNIPPMVRIQSYEVKYSISASPDSAMEVPCVFKPIPNE